MEYLDFDEFNKIIYEQSLKIENYFMHFNSTLKNTEINGVCYKENKELLKKIIYENNHLFTLKEKLDIYINTTNCFSNFQNPNSIFFGTEDSKKLIVEWLNLFQKCVEYTYHHNVLYLENIKNELKNIKNYNINDVDYDNLKELFFNLNLKTTEIGLYGVYKNQLIYAGNFKIIFDIVQLIKKLDTDENKDKLEVFFNYNKEFQKEILHRLNSNYTMKQYLNNENNELLNNIFDFFYEKININKELFFEHNFQKKYKL